MHEACALTSPPPQLPTVHPLIHLSGYISPPQMATEYSTTAFDWHSEGVLVDDVVYIVVGDDKPTAAAAAALTLNGETIEASFSPARPPLRSRVFLRTPDLDLDRHYDPRVVRVVDGLILLFVPFKGRYDLFVYRLHPPLLRRLPHPQALIDYLGMGLLPRRRGEHYTVAALEPNHTETETATTSFTLHLLHSEDWSWGSIEVSLDVPQEEYPIEIPLFASHRHRHHQTNTVITIGGKGGTMGWVDLWRGVLLCDVLRPNPALRGVPLPLPMVRLNRAKIGCPQSHRDIAFIESKRCLSFVDLDVHGTNLGHTDPETGMASVKIDTWVITTWSNSKMSNSLSDWSMDSSRSVNAKSIRFSKMMRKQLLQVQPPPGRELHNLSVCFPIHSADKKVVYLITRSKFLHCKTWLLAVDIENRTVQGLAEFDTVGEPGAYSVCVPGRVFKPTMELHK